MWAIVRLVHRLGARVVASSTSSEQDSSRFLVLADRLFSGAGPPSDPGRLWPARYLAVAAAIAAIVVLRRVDAVTNPQFWAEDGYVYFYENLMLGFPRALRTLYFGYPYLTQRLIALVGGLVPLSAVPRVYTSSAIALTALALATFALPAFRHLVRSDGLRVLFGIGVACLPFDQEVLSNPTNVGWFLAVWLSLLSVMRLPRQGWKVALLTLGGWIVIFTSPLAIVNLPLWLLRVWHGARRRDRLEVVSSAALVAGITTLIALCGHLGAEANWTPSGAKGLAVLADPLGFLGRYLSMTFYWVTALLVRPGRLAGRAADLGPPVVGALLLAGTTVISAAGRLRSLPVVLAATFLFVGSFIVLLLGRPVYFFVLPSWQTLPTRYLVFPGAMLVLMVLATLDALPATRWRTLAGVGVGAVVVWAWSPRFFVPPFRDEHWTRQAALIEEKVRTAAPEPLHIPMNPPWTPLDFDPVDLSRETKVDPREVIADLGTRGIFRQTFVSRCDGLRMIEVQLATRAASTRGALVLEVVESPDGAEVARQTVPRGELGPSAMPRALYFSPITASAGRRYALVVQALENEDGAAIWVLGARDGGYSDGEATLDGRSVEGSASFRYGCARPRKVSP